MVLSPLLPFFFLAGFWLRAVFWVTAVGSLPKLSSCFCGSLQLTPVGRALFLGILHGLLRCPRLLPGSLLGNKLAWVLSNQACSFSGQLEICPWPTALWEALPGFVTTGRFLWWRFYCLNMDQGAHFYRTLINLLPMCSQRILEGVRVWSLNQNPQLIAWHTDGPGPSHSLGRSLPWCLHLPSCIFLLRACSQTSNGQKKLSFHKLG